MIPKPNKTSEVKNLRPISLTSCTGKLLEKLVLTRLEWHLEHVKALPFTLIGYRKNISTQDCLLRLYNDLLQDKSTTQLRSLLSLDIYKAFDNVSHDSILSTLRETQCGPRMYNYIRNFLSNRTAAFKIPGHISTPFPLHQGVPQGSILSPTLFNLAMSKLPAQLDTIPHLKFSIYADDVTLWTNTGSPGQQEETLQHACDTVARYAISIGLACSPSKSELLVISNRKNNPDRQLITVHLDGTPIPQRPHIKLLGLTIQNNGASDINVSTLSKQINQITHILGRVSRRHRGLKESDMRRAIEALIYSLVLYHIPYTPLTTRQLKHLQTQLRKPTRLALGVPQLESWYNPFAPLSQAIGVNLLDNALLRLLTGNHAARIRTTIKVTANPLADQTEQEKRIMRIWDSIIQMVVRLLPWIFAAPGMVGLLLSGFVILPFTETASHAKELQLMTGVSGYLYCLSNFLFDLIIYLAAFVPLAVCFVYLYSLETQSYGAIQASVKLTLGNHWKGAVNWIVLFLPPGSLAIAVLKVVKLDAENKECLRMMSVDNSSKPEGCLGEIWQTFGYGLERCCEGKQLRQPA
ncbi:uncharacterized protein ISCGN_015609 [Ixodes scapularis]